MSTLAATTDKAQRVQALLLAVILALSTALFLVYLRLALSRPAPFNDFLVFWSAARYALQAPLQGVYDPATFDAFRLNLAGDHLAKLPFLYPPFTAFLFIPFGLLPYKLALMAWNACSLAVYVTAVWQAIKPRKGAALAILAAVVAPATIITLMAGQVGLLTGALTLSGFSLLAKRPIAAGILLGLLTLKPQLALLPCLVLLISRQYRACLAATLTVALLSMASALVFGLDAWTGWLHCLGSFATGAAGSENHQQYGITVYLTLLHLGFDKYPALAAQVLTGLAVLWTIHRALRRGLAAPQLMLILVGLYLATPYAAFYDLPVISAVCLMFIAEHRSSGLHSAELLVIAVAWFLSLILILPNLPTTAVGLVVIGGLFILLQRRSETSRVTTTA